MPHKTVLVHVHRLTNSPSGKAVIGRPTATDGATERPTTPHRRPRPRPPLPSMTTTTSTTATLNALDFWAGGRADRRRREWTADDATRSKATIGFAPSSSSASPSLRSSSSLQHLEVSCTLETYGHGRARSVISVGCFAHSGPSFRPSRTDTQTERPTGRPAGLALTTEAKAGRGGDWRGGRANERTNALLTSEAVREP